MRAASTGTACANASNTIRGCSSLTLGTTTASYRRSKAKNSGPYGTGSSTAARTQVSSRGGRAGRPQRTFTDDVDAQRHPIAIELSQDFQQQSDTLLGHQPPREQDVAALVAITLLLVPTGDRLIVRQNDLVVDPRGRRDVSCTAAVRVQRVAVGGL